MQRFPGHLVELWGQYFLAEEFWGEAGYLDGKAVSRAFYDGKQGESQETPNACGALSSVSFFE